MITHESVVGENLSSRAMSGRAMFTMVASRTTINWTARMMPSTRPGRAGRFPARLAEWERVAVVGI